MPAEKSHPQADTEDVRIRAAWFVAGSDTFATVAMVGTVVLGMVGGLLGAIFDVGAGEVVITFAVAEALLLAAVGGYLRLRARSIARNETIKIGPF